MDFITILFQTTSWILCITTVILRLFPRARGIHMPMEGKKHRDWEEKLQKLIWGAIALLAVSVRVWNFWGIPYGLNQDEASIGYDSFAIGTYGYDRNGFHLPLYPIGFGNGHGPLYTYLSIPAIRLLGLSIFSVRITNVLLSVIAVLLSYFLIKELTGSRKTALTGFFLMATAPVLILSSRWALDGCPPPSLFVIALYLFVRATDRGRMGSYAGTAAFFGLICYCYGPVGIVVPVFLAISSIYLLLCRKITFRQLGVSGAVFLLVLAPMMVFILRNMGDAPAVNAFISFPRFTVMRSSVVMQDRLNWGNLWAGIHRILFQPQDLPWNTVPGFGTTYLYTAPLILLGTGVLIWKLKLGEALALLLKSLSVKKNLDGKRPRRFPAPLPYHPLFFLAAYVIASLVLCLLIEQNVNRLSVIYPGVIMVITLAADAVWKQRRSLGLLLCFLTLVSFGGFTASYFGKSYQEYFGNAFFDTFGEALALAMEKTQGTIYVTETYQNEPSILALFYSQLPPDRFYTTVKYYDDTAECRNAMYFDRFLFGIPEEKDPTGVYVIDNSEIPLFDPETFSCETFSFYSVIYPKTDASVTSVWESKSVFSDAAAEVPQRWEESSGH